MIKTQLERVVQAGLLIIAVLVPTQWSVKVAGVHVSLVDPVILLTAGAWAITQFLGNEKTFDFKKIIPPWGNVAFVVLAAASIVKADDVAAGMKELVQLIGYLVVLFVVVSRGVNSPRAAQRLLLAFLCSTSAVILFGLIQYLDSSRAVIDVSSTFGNRNVLGGFLAISLPVALAVSLTARRWGTRVWMGALVITGMVINVAGAAFLALVVGGFAVCLAKSSKAIIGWALFIAVLVAVVFPWTPRKNTTSLLESIQFFDADGRVEPRYVEWQASLDMWRETPSLGVGLGNYQSQIGMFYGILPMPEGPKEPDHNNLFLVTLASTGIVGLLGLMIMLASWLRKAATAFQTNGKDTLRKILALAVIGAIPAFCVDSIWTALIVRGVFPSLVLIVALLHSFDHHGDSSQHGWTCHGNV